MFTLLVTLNDFQGHFTYCKLSDGLSRTIVIELSM